MRSDDAVIRAARQLAAESSNASKRGAALVAVGTVLAAALAAGTSVFLAKELGPSGLGVYSAGMATAGVLAIVAGLGLGPIAIRRATSSTATRQSIAQPTITVTTCSLVLGAVLALAPVRASLVRVFGPASVRTLWLVSILLAAVAITTILSETLRGLKRFGSASFAGATLSRGLAAVALVISSAIGSLTPRSALAITAGSFVLAAAATAMLLVLAARTVPATTDTRGYAPSIRLAVEGAPIAGGRGLAFATAQLPIWVLAVAVSADDVGIYAFAWSVAAVVGLVTPIVNGAISPSLAERWHQRRLAELEKLCRRSANVGLVAAACSFVPALLIEIALIRWFVGTDYSTAIAPTALLLVAVLVRTASGPCFAVLTLSGFQRKALLGAATGFAVALPLVYALSLRFGVTGAALGILAAEAVQQVVLAGLTRQAIGIRTWATTR